MKINLRGRFYYLTMILLPAISIVVKNIIFQAFILGKNMYEVNIVEAIRETRYYWVFYLAITMLILSVTMLIKRDTIYSRWKYCELSGCIWILTSLLMRSNSLWKTLRLRIIKKLYLSTQRSVSEIKSITITLTEIRWALFLIKQVK